MNQPQDLHPGNHSMESMPIKEIAIQRHWESHPVCENVFGALAQDFGGNHLAFFDAVDTWLYRSQGHILEALDRFDWDGKRVLETGPGHGADAEQIVRRGGIWSGIDLTEESVARVEARFKLRGLHFEELVHGSCIALPFPDGSFDMVYAHGVLHHISDILAAQKEIRRVLKPDGRLIAMLYARNSLNYLFSIRWLRRIGLFLLYWLPIPLSGIYEAHRQNARQRGLFEYLRMENFIHRSTDGPDNPYSKVYDAAALATDFPDFEVVRSFQMWMHAPPLPTHSLPGGRWLGWHLWVEMKIRN